MKTPAQRRRRRWLAAIGLGLVLVLGAAFAFLRLELHGAGLGDKIASILNKRMRGRIEIGSIEWSTADLTKAVTGGWFPVTVRDVRVWDDCALSATITADTGEELRSDDPNEDCTPDDRPDPDPRSPRKPRKLLIRTDLATAEIDAHAIMFGNHDFVFRNLWVHGGEALIEQTREPYPLTDYDRTTMSIIAAFSGRMKAGFRAGIYADSPPPIFDLRDIHIQGVNLTLHMVPSSGPTPDQVEYAFVARLERVNADIDPKDPKDPAHDASSSYLYMNATDPLASKFYVRLAVASERASIRILDHGPRTAFRLPALTPLGHPRTAAERAIVSVIRQQHTLEHSFEAYPPPGRSALYSFELTDIKLDRLAQLPSDWAHRTFTATTLEVDLHARALPCVPAGATSVAPVDERDIADVHLAGELFNYADRPYDGAWNLKLDGKNLGPTLRSCIKPAIGGDQLDGSVSLSGPFVASPAIGLDMTGVDFDLPLGATQAPLRLTLAELHGKIDLVNEEGYIEKTKALVRNGKEPGEIELSATFGLKPLYSNAQIEIVKAIDVGRFLPPKVATSVGKFLHGRLRAIGDTVEGFELTDFDLGLGTSERDTAIRLHHGRLFTKDNFGEIQVEKVYVEAGQSHAIVNGPIYVQKGTLGLTIDGDFPDLDVWLKRFQLPALFKSAGGGHIEITGNVANPTVHVNTTLAGVPCIDQLKLENLVYGSNTVDIQRLSSPGLGGQLSGSGRIRLGGATPVIERLDLNGSHLDASKICGLKGIAKGTIDEVDVHVHGALDANRKPFDWLGLGQIYARADMLSILDDRYTGLAACVNRDDDERCRPRSLPVVLSADAARQACDDGKRAADQGGSGFCLVASATRAGGGSLDATIAQLPATRAGTKITAPAHLAGAVSLRDLPMALIDELRGVPGGRAVGGFASLTAQLQGTAGAPQAQGAIDIVRGWIADGFLGDARLDVKPAIIAGVPGIEISGALLAGRLAVHGVIGTAAPFPVELTVSGTRVEVDPFLDLQALLKLPDPVQAWATGKLTVKTELAPARPVDPEAWIELTELALQLDHRASDGRVTPLVVRVKDQNTKQRAALSIHATPTAYELACRAAGQPNGRAPCATILETPAGDIEISGYATRPPLPRSGGKAPAEDGKPQLAIKATGTLDLAKLRVLLDQRFDYVAGRVALDASIAGSFLKPTFELAIDLDPQQIWRRNEAERAARRAAYAAKIKRAEGELLPGENPLRLRPIGSDTVIAAPGGLIKLANGSIGFTDVLVQVRDDRHSDEQGELHIAGNIALDGLTPTSWSVFLTGKIAGKMLQVVEPSFVSQADGLIAINAENPVLLSGTGPSPTLSGTLEFDHFSIFPRGVRRELTFSSGTIDVDTEQASDKTRAYTIAIANVNGTVEDGKLTNISGAFRIKNGGIERASLRLNANSIPFHVPQTLDLTLSASNIELALDAPGANWRVTGTVSVVDGAYLRNFELTDRIQAIGVNSAPSTPFWEEYPALGAADLNLTLVVQLFAVRDNIATIEFRSDQMAITGTPRDPRLSGQIRVTHGEFRIPGTRAAFTRTSGTVDFAENQPANNPALNVTSDADYRDLSGQDHVITATIGGSLRLLTWDLKTSTGYNKSQTLSLLVLGRNQEQLRRSLGDQNLGGDPTRADPTTNPSQGFADQIVKDLAGDWVSDLLGSSLTKLTGLDVLRIEIGFGSIGFHLEKKVFQNLKVTGDAEQTIRGTTIKVQSEIKTPYPISLQGGYLNQNYYDPAEQDIEDINVKLVYRVLIP